MSITLASLIIFAIVLSMTVWAGKHFEVAMIVLLVSSTVHWFTQPADPMDIEEVLRVGPASYARIALVTLSGIMGLIMFLRSRKSQEKEMVPLHFKVLGLFILYALISVSYSIDTTYSLVRSLEFLAFFGFLIGLHHWMNDRGDMDKVLSMIFTVLTIYILVNALSLVVFPERAWSFTYPDRFEGFTTHPNSMGELCMITCPFALWMFSRTSSISMRVFTLCILGAATVMQVMTGSRSTLVGTALCYILWSVLAKKKVLAVIVTLALIGAGSFLISNKPASLARHDSSSITSVTGRDELWQGCIVLIKERPIMGYGYAVGGKIWEDPRFQSQVRLLSGSSRTSLHNGYLDMIIGLGIPGFLLWMVFLALASIKALFQPASDARTCFLIIIAQTLFVNMFETTFVGSRGLGSVIVMISLIMASRLFSFVPHAPSQDEMDPLRSGGNKVIGSVMYQPDSPPGA